MKFITHRIHLNPPKSSVAKTASAAAPVTKTASAVVEKEAKIENLGDYAHGKGGKKKDEKEETVVANETTASTETEIKVAEGEKGEEKYDAGKTEGKLVNDPELPKEEKSKSGEAGAAATTTTKTQDGSFPSSGQPQWEGKAENNNKPEMPSEKNTKASADELLKQILAGLNGKFEKTANMKPELKSKTKEYWRNLYGEDYAENMVSDK